MGIHIEPEIEALSAGRCCLSNYVLDLQKDLLKKLANLSLISTRSINGRKIYWEDFALINNFVLEKYLSTTDVKNLVKMIKQSSLRQFGAEISLPKSWRTISNKINKNFAPTFYAPSRL